MLEEFIAAIWQGFAAITPAGIAPEYFWPTFILVFALVYTLLSKVKIFGDLQEGTGSKKGIYLLISVIFAYFTASSAFATLIIAKMTPQLGMVLVAILAFLLIFGFLSGGKDPYSEAYMKPIIILIVLIGVGYVLLSTVAGFLPGGLSLPTLSAMDMGIIVAVFIIAIVLYFMLK